MNLAFKCTYNDADEGVYVGFNGTCSVDNIIHNIKSGRVWCSNEQCPCKQFYDKGFKGEPPEFPCYESELFNKWCFGGGVYQHGRYAGKPIGIHKAEVGKIAVLTTLFPDNKEKDRKIVGLFKIGSVEDKDETRVYADEDHRIRLPREEAEQLRFWDYYSVSGEKPRWGTHLFRYLDDDAIAAILKDLRSTVRDESTKFKINDLLENDFASFDSSVGPTGMLERKESRARAVAMSRKYGPGGEGKEHRRLKEWIADHPEDIGISNVKRVEKEHPFCSGDRVDVLFELNDGTDVVVEVETLDPLPGCHQAIKYRALRCAERGIPLDSQNVIAYTVAWGIPDEVASFCKKYNVTCQRLRLDG